MATKRRPRALVTPRQRPAVGPKLAEDAVNRGWRTFLVAMLIQLFVDVWPIVSAALTSAEPIMWAVFGKVLLRAGLMAIGAFIMRRVFDPSWVPTPLPPDPKPEPVGDDQG